MKKKRNGKNVRLENNKLSVSDFIEKFVIEEEAVNEQFSPPPKEAEVLKVKYRANSNFTQSLITLRIMKTQIFQFLRTFPEFSGNRINLDFF